MIVQFMLAQPDSLRLENICKAIAKPFNSVGNLPQLHVKPP